MTRRGTSITVMAMLQKSKAIYPLSIVCSHGSSPLVLVHSAVKSQPKNDILRTIKHTMGIISRV